MADRENLRTLGAIVLAALALATPVAADGVSLRLEPSTQGSEHGTFVADGLGASLLDRLRRQPPPPADWRSIFPIYTLDVADGEETVPLDRPPVAGDWQIDDDAIRFRPRYPLVPGLTYVARFDVDRLRALAGAPPGPAAEPPIEARFSLPREHVLPSTVVSAIYPSASELPENLLKLYLHFSAPMGRGDAYRHIRLVDAEGRDHQHVFLAVGEELWDASQRRLTLFFDPGRIKRGLRPHLEAGPPLVEGGSYRLVVDAGWRDAEGLPLARGFEKAFTAGAADRRSPDPGDWRIEPPAAGTRAPLEVIFDESLDHGLASRVVRVTGAGGRPIAGQVEVVDSERRFRFVPEAPWRPGDYQIEVDSVLEDLAGNSLRQVFDLDVRAPRPSGPPVEDVVTLDFAVAAPASAPATEPERPIYDVPSTDSAVEVDGRLDEPAWAAAAAIPLAYETKPAENQPAPVETTLYLTYDRDRLYVAFRASDPDPSKIRARLADRDTVFSDDFAGVALDTFNDGRRAFEFFVNPLGVQMDMTMDDVNENEDPSWDAIWDSAGRVTDTGYVVEMAVPFSSLRFPRTSGPQIWGIDALRYYPRESVHRLAIHPQDRDVDCYVCQMSKLRGFEGITPGRNLEINPTFTAGATEDLADGATDETSDLGVTAGWGITPNLRLSATVNPDFSQVEADVAQLDVNTQFALFFRERRPFFLEDADFFDTHLNAVFTRNVADPTWGLRLTGKSGKHAFGTFVADDELTNLIFPGNQGSRAGSFQFETRDAVLRYRRDMPRNSALGALYTRREGGGYSNSVAGVDGQVRFTKSDTLDFQVLRSETEYPLAVALDFDQPAGAFDDHALRLTYVHADREWRGWAVYEDIGDGFRADMGFIPRVGIKHPRGGLQRTWWGDEDDPYEQLVAGVNYDRVEDRQGRRLESTREAWITYSGPRSSRAELWYWTRDRFFDGREFDERSVDTWLEIRPTGKTYARLWASIGDRVDFANSRPAESVQLEPELRLDFGKHLRATLSHRFFRLEVEDDAASRTGTLFTANLTQARLLYQLNLRTFLRAVLQYTDVDRDLSLYNAPEDFEARTRELFTQLLFSYKINPRTVLFLGYSDNYRGDQDVGLTQQNRALFLKVGYAWVL